MELLCLGSSSRGNCYLLKGKSETLVLECGVEMQKVKKELGWTTKGICCALASHQHGDHAKYIRQYLDSGVRVLALPDVFLSQGLQSHPMAKAVEPLRGYKAGGFKIFTLPVEHDVPCVGFVIEHDEMGKTLFITDTMMLEYKVPGINHYMVEANYSDDILQENIDRGLVATFQRERLMRTHMEIKTAARYLADCDLSEANEVVLLHLSGHNSDARQFRREVAEATGLPVHIAGKGLSLNFSKQPF